jgi:hypothetical protein
VIARPGGGASAWRRCLPLIVGGFALGACASVMRAKDPGAQLVGEWRLDSLAVYPLSRTLPDSTRGVLARYHRTMRTASRQFRTGEVRVTTVYRADGRYDHVVATRDPGQGGYHEAGQWRLDAARRRIWCRNDAGRPCPHDRAVVERATPQELVLLLELTGRGAGLGEYFRLVRIGP